jgi:hypothetical protein
LRTAVGNVDRDAILCHEEERVVARDNTVTLQHQRLQNQPATKEFTLGRAVIVIAPTLTEAF